MPFYKFMLLTQLQKQPLPSYLAFIKDCILGGISSVQLREKNLSDLELEEFAKQLKTLLDTYRIPLIINDNVPLALKLDAAGVHLGQSDLSVCEARKILGNNKYIGLSVESKKEFKISCSLPVNYIAASAVFETKTKTNLKKIWGLEGLKKLSSTSVHPVVAIGGINQSNLSSVMEVGASGIALIGEVHNAKNPKETCENIAKIIKKWDGSYAG